MSLVKKVHRLQIVRFAVVGLFCAGIEFALFALLVDTVGTPYLQANLISLLTAVFLNYLISRKLVFERGKHSRKVEFTAFMVFTALGVFLNQFLVWFFVEQAAYDVRLGKVFAIGLAAIFNYFTKKYLVFKK